MRKRLLATIAVATALAGCGVHSAPKTHVSTGQGVPLAANYSAVPVYTLAGQQVFLNAQVTPMFFFSPQNPGAAVKELDAIKSIMAKIHPARPLVLVATLFPTGQNPLKQAESSVQSILNTAKASMPTVLQAGSPSRWIRTAPAFVYYLPAKNIAQAKLQILYHTPNTTDLVVALDAVPVIQHALLHPTTAPKTTVKAIVKVKGGVKG